MNDPQEIIQVLFRDMGSVNIFREIPKLIPEMFADTSSFRSGLRFLLDNPPDKISFTTEEIEYYTDRIKYTSYVGYFIMMIHEYGYLLEATYGWWWATKIPSNKEAGKVYKDIQVQRTDDHNPAVPLGFLLREIIKQEKGLP
jgi:hypothetical protein